MHPAGTVRIGRLRPISPVKGNQENHRRLPHYSALGVERAFHC